MLESFLFKVKDHRRQQGRRYELGHILLFSILAILSGARSYRKIHRFIVVHYETLADIFGLDWERIPPIPLFGGHLRDRTGTKF